MEYWGRDEEVHSRSGRRPRQLLALGVASFGVLMILAVIMDFGQDLQTDIISASAESVVRVLSQDVSSSTSSLKNGRWNISEYNRSVSDHRLMEVKLFPVEVRGRIKKGWMQGFSFWCTLRTNRVRQTNMSCPTRWAAYLSDEGEWSTPGLRLCPEVYQCVFFVSEHHGDGSQGGKVPSHDMIELDLRGSVDFLLYYHLMFEYTRNRTARAARVFSRVGGRVY